MEDVGDSLILILIREASFLTLIGGICFITLPVIKKEYSNLDEFSNFIPSFNGSHDVKSTLFWIEKIDKAWNIFPWKIMLSLWLKNLKEGQRHGEISFKTFIYTKATTYKNLEADEKIFTSP